MSNLPTVYYGAVINPQNLTSYQALPNCLLAVSATGEVDWIVEDVVDSMVEETMAQKGYIDAHLLHLKSGEFIMPGFIDTHTHAPQFPNIGSGQQYELLQWLDKVTFPMEAKFRDEDFARHTYQSVVRRIIDCGTTTCCYYGSIHIGATKILADIVHSYGQRAFVGKCNMDRESPDYYREHSATSIDDTKKLIAHIRGLYSDSVSKASDPLIHPILTPRFAISCSDKLLANLGSLAASDSTLHIQTHISENHAEVEFTKQLFPSAKTYAGVYDSFGLLRKNTILAHAVHLEDEEVELIGKRGAGISHCPTSNFNLSSGMARVGYYLDKGVKVGLGTDVSGGFSPSILRTIQDASIASKVIAINATSSKHTPSNVNCSHNDGKAHFTNRQLSVATLLHLATLGGAQVCDLAARVGSFAPGKSFDALLVTVRGETGNPGLWGADLNDHQHGKDEKDVLKELLEQFMFCGDDRNIQRVFVQGRLIGGREFRK